MDKIEFFKSLGMSEYEAKALSSLAKLQIATPKQISQDSSVPQNKLYSIFQKFQEQGILARIPSEIKKYKLINFKTFLANKIKENEIKLKEIKRASKNLGKIKENEEEFSFHLIKGQRAIMNKISETNQKVKKEILGVQRNWKVWGSGLREMEKAVKKGVDVKLIGIVDKETEKRAKEWKSTGAKIRKYNKKFGEFPLRFSIFDNKQARITIGKPEIPNPEDYITIWTTSKPLINMLRKQFEELWRASSSY